MQVIGKPRRTVAVALLAATSLTAVARADTLDVPAEHATIQAAIVAAQPGDTVLVGPGRYVERIDFLGKAITVESSGGAALTTIDGDGGSVVTCTTLETHATVLRGFTVTGGAGSVFSVFVVGGGLKLVNGSPKIQECVITGNSAPDMGGGVFVNRSTYPPAVAPLLMDCVISYNSTGPSSSYSTGGGGVAVYPYFSGAILESCTLVGNSTHGSGGGFAIPDRGGLTLTDCVITGNTAAKTGGGGNAQGCCSGTFLKLEDCIVDGNHAAQGGGGLSGYVAGDGTFSISSIEVNRCRFSGNSAGTTSGGALALTTGWAGFASVSNCLIFENSALGAGGGIAVGGYGFIEVLSCTVTRNTAAVNAGIAGYSRSYAPQGCIVWGNVGGQFTWGPATPSYCDIEGGYAGIGNIDIDPQFKDPDADDFHLAPTSACLDAGNPSFPAYGTDIDGDPRVLFGRIDIGADEATTPKGPWTFLGHALAGASGAPTLAGTGALTPGSETTLSLSGAAPGSAYWLVAGAGSLLQPFKGGVMVPALDMLMGPIGVGPLGSSALSGRWPNAVPQGFTVSLQAWFSDASGPAGFLATNGLAAESQ